MKKLFDQGKSFREIARATGVSHQLVGQLLGPTGRHRAWRQKAIAQETTEAVTVLFHEGFSDTQIAERLSISPRTVSKHRRIAGLERSSKKWTKELIIARARYWYGKYGHLTATDWNPSAARAMGHDAQAERFYAEDVPYTKTVQDEFGSFEEMKRKAGLPRSPSGGKAIGLWKTSRLSS